MPEAIPLDTQERYLKSMKLGSTPHGHFGVVLGCTGGGVKKKRRRKQGSTGKTSQDKPTQAKGSLRGQMACSESGWCLAEAVDVSLGDHVKV